MKHNLFEILKEKMMKAPSHKIDQFILKKASDKLEPFQKSKTQWRSIFAGTAFVALVLVVWLQVTQTPTIMLTESPELLQEIDDVEMLVEFSQFSDDEWSAVLNGDS